MFKKFEWISWAATIGGAIGATSVFLAGVAVLLYPLVEVLSAAH